MIINSASRATTAQTDQTRDLRSDSDRAPDEFAGMFAGAMNATSKKPEPKKPDEGTSELDKQKPEDGDDVKSAKHHHHHHHGADKVNATDAKVAVAQDATMNGTNPSPDAIIQSTAALDPELQAKLARVIARMQTETGHGVKVAETYRSQGRQNMLFAQGRETPGQIVTWTKNSKHTQGRAVDLILDGGTAGNDAYNALQRIAREEGLRTLGAKDPGHLELPGSDTSSAKVMAGAANDVTPTIPVEPADATGPGQVSIARLAQVAQVAQVTVAQPAKPAEVARVATVASVANATNATNATNAAHVQTNGAPKPGVTDATTTSKSDAIAKPQARSVATDSSSNAAQRFGGQANADSGSGSDDTGSSKSGHRSSYSSLAAAVALRDGGASFHNAIQDVGSAAPSMAAERAARLIAAFEDAPARPLSQITMSVDAGNGATDRIQVALRGSSLNAVIDAADAHGAQTMNSRADELVRALSKDGISVDSLRVRAAAGTATVAASSQSHSSSDSSMHSRSDRSNPWQGQDRQRSRDDRREQQRQRRGGQNQ